MKDPGSMPGHEWHRRHGAQFVELKGLQVPAHYGDSSREFRALAETAGVLDLSFRSRLCLIGADRQRFLHGQVTNDIGGLQQGQGCYAALVTAKGRMVSDLNVYVLENELLLDFEPGLTPAVTERLEKYIIADDVQVVEVNALYGLLSVQGPSAALVATSITGSAPLPTAPFRFITVPYGEAGTVYVINQPRLGGAGFDLFIPSPAMEAALAELKRASEAAGGGLCGWEAFEMRRIEQGIPRFGADMDDSNLPQETGLEARAISYRKGCYIGQEIIARVRTYGQVAKALRRLRFVANQPLPKAGDKLLKDGKDVGWVTAAVASPLSGTHVGLGYVRREVNAIGTALRVQTGGTETDTVVAGEVN